MRIGFDAKRLFHNRTGLGNYSRDLLRILMTYYNDNSYFLYTPKKPSTEFFLFENGKNPVTVIPSSKFKKISSLWRSYFVKTAIQQDNLDIYHGLSGEIPIGLPSKIKKVVTIHDLIFIRYPKLYSFWDRKLHYWKFKYAAQKSDCVIAISEQTKKDIIEFLKISPDKIHVVYQGCSSFFKENYSPEEVLTVKNKFSLPDQFILNVGTLEVRKNALSIVKALKGTDIPLILIGKKTSYYKEIEAYIKGNNMTNVFHLSSISQKELAVIYQLATVFVYPSIFEGFGIPIIEALYSRTAVITNKNGVFPEAGGNDSIYVEPYDIDKLKEKILLLYNDHELREKITQKGYEFAQKFNDENIANNLIAIYQKTVSCD